MFSGIQRYGLTRCSLILFLVSLLYFTGCQEEQPRSLIAPPSVGFYHWQQQLSPDSLPLQLLTKPELFVRCFDVVWEGNQPTAVAHLEIDSTASLAFEIVPVVFITNEVMHRLLPEGRKALAQNIIDLLGDILNDPHNNQTISYQELQIDCDWTANSKASYFQFLQELKQLLPEQISLSVTVRLHQFLDRKTQGIPPVDRGSLMAYNVGKLSDWNTTNSIIDSNITAIYLQPEKPQKAYPLPLDIALPAYAWGTIYRNGKLVYLIDELQAGSLSDSTRFQPLQQHRYFVSQTTYLEGYLLYPGDQIRLESSDFTTLTAVAKQLNVVPAFDGQRLLFYRIGSDVVRNTTADELEYLAKLMR